MRNTQEMKMSFPRLPKIKDIRFFKQGTALLFVLFWTFPTDGYPSVSLYVPESPVELCSSLLIPIMGWSCLFHEKWRVHDGILHPSIQSGFQSPLVSPWPIVQIPRIRNQERLQYFSRSRPCRGCPPSVSLWAWWLHWLTPVCWFLVEYALLAFLCSVFRELLKQKYGAGITCDGSERTSLL